MLKITLITLINCSLPEISLQQFPTLLVRWNRYVGQIIGIIWVIATESFIDMVKREEILHYLIFVCIVIVDSCCSTIDSHWHSLLLYKPHKWLPWCCKKIVWAVDKYPIHNGGAHKKYIHMKCGCCKALFIGCEVIGKSILKSNQWLNQKKGAA